MNTDEIATEALRLPPKQRALLAGSLWESLDDPFVAVEEVEEAAIIALAAQRDQDIEGGQAQAVAHNDMMARLRG